MANNITDTITGLFGKVLDTGVSYATAKMQADASRPVYLAPGAEPPRVAAQSGVTAPPAPSTGMPAGNPTSIGIIVVGGALLLALGYLAATRLKG